MNDFEKLTKTFNDVGINYTVRINPYNNKFKYLFLGDADLGDWFEKTNLRVILKNHNLFEFEDDNLVSN